jgi:hypothetical protein
LPASYLSRSDRDGLLCLKDLDHVAPHDANAFRKMMCRSDKARRVELGGGFWLEVGATAPNGSHLSVMVSVPSETFFETTRYAVEMPDQE